MHSDECIRANTATKRLMKQLCSLLRTCTGQIGRELSKLPQAASETRARKIDEKLQTLQTELLSNYQTVQLSLARTSQGLEFAREAAVITAQCLHSALDENRALKEELTGALASLRAIRDGDAGAAVKQVPAGVTPPEQHAEMWAARMNALADMKLPEIAGSRAEALHPLIPAFLVKTNSRNIFTESVSDIKPVVVETFRDVTSVDAGIAADLERITEVTAFADEIDPLGDAQSADIAKEAYSNSIALLEQRERTSTVDAASLERRILSALVRVLAETRSVIDRGQLGVFARWTASGSQHVTGDFIQVAGRLMRASSRWAVTEIQNVRYSVYRKIGLLPPRWERVQPISVRSRLGSTLQLRGGPADLPSIYRRLFRVDPVTDPRFLIGRDEEMAAIRSAHAGWVAGRQAVVLLIGARGSGKTSLLNCAEQSVLPPPVFRLSFRERLRSWEQLEAFLFEKLSLPCRDLESQLCSSRRIIVLEEFERSYLRVMGGFDTARRLLELIEATSRSTMWILVASRVATPMLNAALSLNRIVAVQINAAAVKEETLRNAILQRHNLSGFRLRFAPPPLSDLRVTKLQRILGVERDPADLFFESLYLESQGIFRSAFELWQGSVQQIDCGTLVMKQPLRPEYGRLRTDVDLTDVFAIHAIAQHGSLTAEETAEVLDMEVARSRRILDRLQDMDLIEPDPERPGLRLSPRAIRFAYDMLRGRNLV